jgi:phosphoribosyl-ATP pyrophosphohydrolase
MRFIEDEKARLYIPKNGGLCDYVSNMLQEIGAKPSLQIVLERGEDIPKVVDELNAAGIPAYGLTGDDLFDEYCMKTKDQIGIGILNTYDWFDESAVYRKPALCLMSTKADCKGLPSPLRVAVKSMYSNQARQFLDDRFRDREKIVSEYRGDTETRINDNLADCCIDIVYSGNSLQKNNLKVCEIIRFSDIDLLGKKKTKSVFETEYERICDRVKNPTDSYTSRLLQDENEIIKKKGQENAELIAAFVKNQGVKGEFPDDLYAGMMMAAKRGLSWRQIEDEIKRRWV